MTHPEFLRIMGSGSGDNFTTELCPATLEDLIHVLRFRPSLALLASLSLDIANALMQLHHLGEFHGDVCPQNLFVTDNCNCKVCVLERYR